ncbi:MAG: hypothetical protein ACRDQH_03310 [Pseudonocardiaceae bacterium]
MIIKVPYAFDPPATSATAELRRELIVTNTRGNRGRSASAVVDRSA